MRACVQAGMHACVCVFCVQPNACDLEIYTLLITTPRMSMRLCCAEQCLVEVLKALLHWSLGRLHDRLLCQPASLVTCPDAWQYLKL